jgi:endonuclease I
LPGSSQLFAIFAHYFNIMAGLLNITIKRFLLGLLLGLYVLSTSNAQIPAGYYDDAAGLTGYTLKTALYNIIKDHTVVSYNSLYSYYPKTDFKAGNVVWDMYSDVPGGTPAYIYHHTSSDQCGSYNSEGDCYNREHTFAASWFNDASPMYSDLFNVIPTDGYVNNQRSNYPFAEVGIADFTSTNGSKLGPCSFPGWIYTVFEPIDEYKGDFARALFYMATRYENLIAGWQGNSGASSILAGNSTSVYWQWYINQLVKWHEQDIVSTKEIARNDSIYKIQHNRNPFIDHPEWVEEIWTSTLDIDQSSIEETGIQLYPVPADEQVTVLTPSSIHITYCLISSLYGQNLGTLPLENGNTLSIAHLKAGFYLLSFPEHQDLPALRLTVY